MAVSAIAEIIRDLPDIPKRYLKLGAPLFIAYDCLLIERGTDKGYIYRAINLKTGASALICRRRSPLREHTYIDMVLKIKASPIAGPGRLEIRTRPGDRILYRRLAEIQRIIFEDIMPRYGYSIRSKQMELADHILWSIYRRALSLAEAEVGTGKTHAYIIAAALAKLGHVNELWLTGKYGKNSYISSNNMPVVISTSSIALQKAIVNDYLPEISRIFIENGVISKPLTCVIRKGREHYICDYNLQTYYSHADANVKTLLNQLITKESGIDLDDMDKLSDYIKRRICVNRRCDENCSYSARKNNTCRYKQFLEKAQSPLFDFQISNHNYFLADVIRRSNGQTPLIPHYQAVIIDEAHKFLHAARQMYGIELNSRIPAKISDDIKTLTFCRGQSGDDIKKNAIMLAKQSKRLFGLLNDNIPAGENDDETERFKTVIDDRTARYLRDIGRIIDDIVKSLSERPVISKYQSLCSQILYELEEIKKRVSFLSKHNDIIYWLEKPDCHKPNELYLCAIPKNLNKILFNDLWSKGIPVILTSGTLSVAGDFGHIKRITGLQLAHPGLITETSKPSPFNYNENVLMYISSRVPFPNNQDQRYIVAVAEEIGHLINAAYGHAVVLFTSYKTMNLVFDIIERSHASFPLFRLDRGNVNTIEAYNQSGNGVLFATGAMWEGIDLPGDILSLLVIVKLPFSVPNPISEHEQTFYNSIEDYINEVVVPEMLVKLKQGFGRLIRNETDTGGVAMLDSRVRKDGAYHDKVLASLPECRITSRIGDVKRFIKLKKGPSYFNRLEMEYDELDA